MPKLVENDGSLLRPKTFEDYIGQEQLKLKLKIAIQAAKERNEPMPSVLLAGGPGLGKTTLAHIIANEYGTKCKVIMSQVIASVGDILEVLVKTEKNSFVFIDEIHRLSAKLEESLYSPLEDFKCSIKVASKDIVHIPINPFCLIGATTNLGSVSEPLRDRFGIIAMLDSYTIEELAKIVKINIGKLNLKVAKEEIYFDIANRCRGVPRLANRLVYRIRDWAQLNTNNNINDEAIEYAMQLEGIDKNGLTDLDIEYLYTLYKNFAGGPAGIASISAAMNESKEYIEDFVEPFLMRLNLIVKTKSGRVITGEGVKYII